MEKTNVNQHKSYWDVLRETQQEEFPLLSEVTNGLVDNPLALMNAHTDDDGVVVPCGLPDAMVQSLPQCFTTVVANEKGGELGIKERAVSYHLRTLCAKGYIERIRQGVYRKAIKRVSRKNRLAA